MNVIDIIVIFILLFLFSRTAFILIKRNKKRGSCAGCHKNCNCCNLYEDLKATYDADQKKSNPKDD